MCAQCNTLLLPDVFEKLRNMCPEVYELDPIKFISASGLKWLAALQKTTVKLDLSAGINIFIMAEKGIRGGICYSIYRYGKANNRYMKDYNKTKESSYLEY